MNIIRLVLAIAIAAPNAQAVQRLKPSAVSVLTMAVRQDPQGRSRRPPSESESGDREREERERQERENREREARQQREQQAQQERETARRRDDAENERRQEQERESQRQRERESAEREQQQERETARRRDDAEREQRQERERESQRQRERESAEREQQQERESARRRDDAEREQRQERERDAQRQRERESAERDEAERETARRRRPIEVPTPRPVEPESRPVSPVIPSEPSVPAGGGARRRTPEPVRPSEPDVVPSEPSVPAGGGARRRTPPVTQAEPVGRPVETPNQMPAETTQPRTGGAPTGRAVRRIPPEARPNLGRETFVGKPTQPDKPLTQGPRGEPLGRAVRRDDFPRREHNRVIGHPDVDRDVRNWNRTERTAGRHYWHDYDGHRYSHYVDRHGDDWYYWQFGNDYYTTRYHGGRWWRHDSRSNRWCWLHEDNWLYDDGTTTYVYLDDRYERYEYRSGAVILTPETPAVNDPAAPLARYYSEDGARLVRLDEQRNAFLYDVADETPSFTPRFLAAAVEDVHFAYIYGRAAGITVTVAGGAKLKFTADGDPDRPVVVAAPQPQPVFMNPEAPQRPSGMRFVEPVERPATARREAAPRYAVGISGGQFLLGGKRGADDVLTGDKTFLNFDQRELNGASGGGEVLFGAGNHIELGAGVGFFSGSANSSYTDYVRQDGSEIRQQLKLTAVPVTAVARVFPLGRDKKVQPYVGAGVAATRWRYQESGDFIDFGARGTPVYSETYSASGTALGPVLLAGIRVPVGKRVTVGGEYRRQSGAGALPSGGDFAGSKVELGGNSLQGGITINLGKR